MIGVKEMLLQDEGLSLRPYTCTAGYLTIGVGRNLESSGINREEAMYLLDNDIRTATAKAETFDWFYLLTFNRQAVVVCMIFQIGFAGFKEFKKMIAALEKGDHDEAAKQMLDSRWAKQTPARAKKYSQLMKEG